MGLPEKATDVFKDLITVLVTKIIDGGDIDDEAADAEDNEEEEEEGAGEGDKENEGAEANAPPREPKKKKKSKDKKKRRRSKGSDEEQGSPDRKKRKAEAVVRKPKAKPAPVRAPKAGAKPALAVSREQALADRLKQLCRMASIPIAPGLYSVAAGSAEELGLLLEELLGTHGLTVRSTADEVKAVRKKLEQERDLQGITVGNIVEGERRRGAEEAGAGPRVNRYLKKLAADREAEEAEGSGGGSPGGHGLEDSDVEDEDDEEGREGGETQTQAPPVRTILEDSDAEDGW